MIYIMVIILGKPENMEQSLRRLINPSPKHNKLKLNKIYINYNKIMTFI